MQRYTHGLKERLYDEFKRGSGTAVGVSHCIEYTAATICHVKRRHMLKGSLDVLYERPRIFDGYDGCPDSEKTTKIPPPAENRRAVYAKLLAEAERENAGKAITPVENGLLLFKCLVDPVKTLL